MADTVIDTSGMPANIKRTVKRINAVLSKIKDPAQKREVLTKASEPVIDKAQRLAPIGKPRGGVLRGAASATYATPKLVSNKRAAKGQGVIKSRYYPKNLERSIQVLPLKKTARAVIGPRVLRRGRAKSYGKSAKSNTNAFYAQMIFGSARAFQKRIMITALQSSKSRAAQIIASETRKALLAEKKKQRL